MDMQGALRARLIADGPLAGLLADHGATKAVFWGIRPQDSALNAITLQTISAPRDQHMKGAQAVQWVRVQADCWSATFGGALAMAKRVIAIAEAAATVEGIKFRRASVEGPVDRGEQTEAAFVHRQQVDLMFFYSDA